MALHKQLSQHPTTSPSATLLLEVQLPLLGTSPKVYNIKISLTSIVSVMVEEPEGFKEKIEEIEVLMWNALSREIKLF